MAVRTDPRWAAHRGPEAQYRPPQQLNDADKFEDSDALVSRVKLPDGREGVITDSSVICSATGVVSGTAVVRVDTTGDRVRVDDVRTLELL